MEIHFLENERDKCKKRMRKKIRKRCYNKVGQRKAPEEKEMN